MTLRYYRLMTNTALGDGLKDRSALHTNCNRRKLNFGTSNQVNNGDASVNLILWRHAEAKDTSPDFERQLTIKGEWQAKLMAKWLKPRLPKNLRILASPAARSRQTADALSMDYSLVKELAPGADPASVLNAAGWPDAGDNVLVVGHQPTLGLAASLLVTGEESAFGIKKGGIVWIARREREERGENVLRAVLSPEMLKDPG